DHALARSADPHRRARPSDRGCRSGRGDLPLFRQHGVPGSGNRPAADGRARGTVRRRLSPALSGAPRDAGPLVQEARLELHGQSYRPARLGGSHPGAHGHDSRYGCRPMNLFSLSFGAPMLLWGLISLPVIWWLLLLPPPRPQQEAFPPLAILIRIVKREEMPHQSPWWLTLLRLVLAALIILALADPVFNPRERISV